MTKPNRVVRQIQPLHKLPSWLFSFVSSFAFNRLVPFSRTAGQKFVRWDHTGVEIFLKNRKKVQNHIKTPHAAAMVLAAETASGAAMAWFLPDDKLPLIKNMDVAFVKRASGDISAVASITPEQIAAMENEEKGSFWVEVTITDAVAIEPVIAKMEWAWITKR
ncbi:DUF4442 domain-containing protein [Paraferrimonas haliotis]|uniref:DUF4442 domain-containing protein n=1 Tax=Paraferrimonas haliotis TaxID=2013866 RepID=A0AA37WXD0_9GAMM|nr:DUF4442 domain-containing protein [Paraferrimonas haliotis]GLS83314.1 hypothetical protein GCM10007894_12910 [Paraferrimonas haliotis]